MKIYNNNTVVTNQEKCLESDPMTRSKFVLFSIKCKIFRYRDSGGTLNLLKLKVTNSHSFIYIIHVVSHFSCIHHHLL